MTSVSHNVCKQCVEGLGIWTKGTRDKMLFGIPIVWRESRDHSEDCYFCTVKTSGYNKNNKYNIGYPSLPSAVGPVPHSAEIPEPVFVTLPSADEHDDACLKKELRYRSFEPEKGYFCNTLKMMVVLYI